MFGKSLRNSVLFSFFFPFGLSFFSPSFGLHFSYLFFPSGPLPESSAFLAPVTVHADFKATAALHHLAYAKLLRLTNEIADNRANQDNPQGWELASNRHLYTTANIQSTVFVPATEQV
ncbi:hypothetical protein M441DRAFT_60629 [Trichoderma asperellum CBS 433.97]|uniref:Uncharacterized protein n=1 Tax=Trichoderma asperellum (strain ATCC 204424 / CBS 433.97 / NBRC 101777) TaxID=1042311 RepID=A0A2T3Z0Q0_TRIA4|nr:hypothetical protein M441DRAFT_60629 [Trichoderma asperellum CBS 433.97]PTB38399.1 hypothetical protein M441DRAFT_60629 [Trichoderma asperellum CBS 433.97]